MLIKQIILSMCLQVKWLVSQTSWNPELCFPTIMEPKVAQQHRVTKTRQGRNPDLRFFDGVCTFLDGVLRPFCGTVCSPKMHAMTKKVCLGVLTSSLQNGSMIPVDSSRSMGLLGLPHMIPFAKSFASDLVGPLHHAKYLAPNPLGVKLHFGSFCPFRLFCPESF